MLGCPRIAAFYATVIHLENKTLVGLDYCISYYSYIQKLDFMKKPFSYNICDHILAFNLFFFF